MLLLCGVGSAAAEKTLPHGNAVNGEKLHAAYCMTCHDAKIYTRANRRVNNLQALIGQVKTCSRLTKEPLTPAQVDDLTAYLNETYYRFK